MTLPISQRVIAVAVALTTVLSLPALAQQPTAKLRVYVDHSGEDAVGQLLVYSLREDIRRSTQFEVSTPKDALLTVVVVTLDMAAQGDQRGLSSAVAVTHTMANWLPLNPKDPQTWYPIYLTTQLQTVGRNRVETMSKSILAKLDEEVEAFRALIK